MEKIDVTTSVGNWTLIKPKAGVRNDAMIAAEKANGKLSEIKLAIILLSKCVATRPENFDKTVPIDDQIRDLSTEDYDKLAEGLFKLIKPDILTEEKKT